MVPVMGLVTLFVTICSVKIFSADFSEVGKLDGSLLPAGITIQIYYILMLLRDSYITFSACR